MSRTSAKGGHARAGAAGERRLGFRQHGAKLDERATADQRADEQPVRPQCRADLHQRAGEVG